MTEGEKLEMLKAIMEMPEDYDLKDNELKVFLKAAKKEILNWLYSGHVSEDISDVPSEYEMTQIWAVVAGYNLIGAENQRVSIENGVHRNFQYSDMLHYIRANVRAYARIAR